MAVAVERPEVRRRRRARRGEGPRRAGAGAVGAWLLALMGALLAAFPLYWMFVTAVSPIADLRSGDYGLLPSQFLWENFTRLWEDFPFGRWFVNSVVIAVVAVALTVTINLVCGYAFAKLRFPGRRILFVLIISTLIIPVQVLMVPQFQIVADLGWVDSYWGVIIPRAAEAFGIFFCVQFFRSIPDELIEAARLDGAGELTILRRIVLPLSKPLIAVLIIFTFMWRWNEFAWPLIVLKDSESYTLPIGLRFLQGQFTTDYPALMAGSLMSVLPMLAIFVFFQRYFIEGVVRSGLK
jgi:ABC-type glycerol-3-phosphate transport system permease component